MDEIIEILEKILTVSQDYETKLVKFETDLKTNLMSNIEGMSFENQIKGQAYAFGLLRDYITNQITSIGQFNTIWTTEQKVKYLISFDSHGLTNGKFYDYAVGHEMWRNKRPDLYNLIQQKIEEFCILEKDLKFAFRKFMAKNYENMIWYYPSSLLKILKNELESGNEIIESSADDYFDHKLFFKFKNKFTINYNDQLTDCEYRNVNDEKYWNEEYQDYFIVVTSGFEIKKTATKMGLPKWGLKWLIQHLKF